MFLEGFHDVSTASGQQTFYVHGGSVAATTHAPNAQRPKMWHISAKMFKHLEDV